jgi:hypothetical protein
MLGRLLARASINGLMWSIYGSSPYRSCSHERTSTNANSHAPSQEIVPTSRMFASANTVHLLPTDNGDGTLSVPVVATRSGTYASYVSLVSRGGLTGRYYRNPALQEQGGELTRTDSALDFDWQSRGPFACYPSDDFSVRWSGFVRPAFTEVYTIGLRADDSASLWLDDSVRVETASSSPEWNVFTVSLAQVPFCMMMRAAQHTITRSRALPCLSSPLSFSLPHSLPPPPLLPSVFPCWLFFPSIQLT